MTPARLPSDFAMLEPFLDHWGRETSQARLEARCTAEMDEIRAFYDAITQRAHDALQYLGQYTLADMPPPARNLLALVLAMAQAHVAVEIHGQGRAPGTPWPNTIRISRGLPVLG